MKFKDLYYKLQIPLLYAYSAGSGISAFRNPILAAVELGSGMSPHDSANSRLLGTATNFFLSGPAYALGRDALEKRFGFRDKNSPPEANKRMIERSYGFICSLAELSVNYAMYRMLGAKEGLQSGVPAVASWALTAFGGNQMGRAIDTFKDSLNIPNNGRSFLPDSMNLNDKRKVSSIVNLISLGGLAAYYISTR